MSKKSQQQQQPKQSNYEYLIAKNSIFNDNEFKKYRDNIIDLLEYTTFNNDSFSNNETTTTTASPQQNSSRKDQVLDIEMISNLTISDRLMCSVCKLELNDRDEQIAHYKSDLHRFNLKQKLNGKACVTSDEFENLTEISSISGTDSTDNESDDDDDYSNSDRNNYSEDDDDGNQLINSQHYGGLARNNPKISFRLNDNTVLILYRCLLHGRKNLPEKGEDIFNNVRSMSSNDQWCMILVNAGHFAAAIFKGDEVLLHKTFHRYVVRAKRGTVQSVHDDSGRHAKSAGANIRRHQEAAFKDDIKSLMELWKKELDKCKCIFLRAPKYNKQIFFAGRQPIFTKYDTRIRNIPFVTYRPTFNEVKRAHGILSTFELYNSLYLANNENNNLNECNRKSATNDKQQKAMKSKLLEATEKKLKKVNLNKNNTESDDSDDDIDEEGSNSDEDKNENDDDDEQEQHVTSIDQRKHVKRKLKPLEKEQAKKAKESSSSTATTTTTNNCNKNEAKNYQTGLDNDSMKIFNEIYSFCITNDYTKLTQLFNKYKSYNDNVNNYVQKIDLDHIINQRLDEIGSTLLHLVSQLGNSECVWLLLLNGADPTIATSEHSRKVPYLVSKTKHVRDQYRRFMHEYPLLYDYNLAKIPSGFDPEKEIEKRAKEKEKKRIQRKLKKEREQEVKQFQSKVDNESEDKKRFLALTDEEKRMLLVDRKYISTVAKNTKIKLDKDLKTKLEQTQQTKLMQNLNGKQLPIIISRCWYCGDNMSSNVPFEYFDYKFCSTKCLKLHRQINREKELSQSINIDDNNLK